MPLNYRERSGQNIEVFVRELRRERTDEKPYLLYLQGGPGFEVARPTALSGWQECALEFLNILLMDQRGTGFGTPFEISMVSSTEMSRLLLIKPSVTIL